MRAKHHFRLLALATLVWAGFLLAGLPDYYQQYSTGFMVASDLVVLLPISVIFHRVLARVPSSRRLLVSLWIAFYFTVPLAVYDYVYCGRMPAQRHGRPEIRAQSPPVFRVAEHL